MTGQQPEDNAWQWADEQWDDRPTAPATPEQVPESDDGEAPAWLRRLMRWARS